MYLTVVGLTLAPGIADRHLDAQVLVDVLWAVAGPGRLVEHISVRTRPRNLDVGVYSRAQSQSDADRQAHELVERAATTVPLLRGWAVQPPPTPSAGRPAAGA